MIRRPVLLLLLLLLLMLPVPLSLSTAATSFSSRVNLRRRFACNDQASIVNVDRKHHGQSRTTVYKDCVFSVPVLFSFDDVHRASSSESAHRRRLFFSDALSRNSSWFSKFISAGSIPSTASRITSVLPYVCTHT